MSGIMEIDLRHIWLKSDTYFSYIFHNPEILYTDMNSIQHTNLGPPKADDWRFNVNIELGELGE